MSLLLDHPSITDATRREFLTLLAAAGLLTGCAGPAGSPPPAPGYPRTVDHPGGTLTLPAPPQRVAVVNAQFVRDQVFAAGGRPVLMATSESNPLTPWLTAAGAGDVATFAAVEPDLETVAAARPDLIVDNVSTGPSAYERVAPVLGLTFTQSVPEQLRLLGQVLGTEDVVEQRLTDLRAAIDGWRPAWRPERITVFFAAEDGPFVYLPDSGPGNLLDELGLPLDRRGRTAGEFGFGLSGERLGELDADLLLAVVPYPDFTAPIDELEVDPLFARVPAVAQGRYRRLSNADSQALLWASGLSIPPALDVLGRVLAETA